MKILYVLSMIFVFSALMDIILSFWENLPIKEEENDVHFYITKNLSEYFN